MPRFPWLFKPAQGDEAPALNDDGKALVAYLQKLGTNIGDWRETFTPTRLISGAAIQLSARDKQALIPKGKRVYQRRCIGCHGAKGDGKGPAARFFKTKPRDFTSGIFKFRSTGGGANTLPSDQDLFITITHGLWGTPMPPWYKISSEERLAVIQYIKTFSNRWQKEPVNPPIDIPPEPAVTAASITRGKGHFMEICFTCHGKDGKGDGPLAASLTDTWGHAVTPANFTLPAGASGGVKLGHDGTHIFKTIMTGVGGTPMPAFAGTFKPGEVWDIVHFIQSLRVDAHVQHMQVVGLDKSDVDKARLRIWDSLSQAAANDHIGDAVAAGNYYQPPAKVHVTQAAATQTKGTPSL
jgi:cytochrome c oxidase cbb3-type subunit I/II